MCLALYIGSQNKLPSIPYRKIPKSAMWSDNWPAVAQRFCIESLNDKQEIVRQHFSTQNVVFAGSWEGCSCGFNYGRQYPDFEDDENALIVAKESVEELVGYIRNHEIQEIFTCLFDDEALPRESEKTVSIDELLSSKFVFKERELLHIQL